MSLSTTQYGYIIDPMVPFTDASGTTIRNGYVRVFVAGTSTPVITYKNFDGATNEETVQLDNSGRTAYPVIGSKGSTYKVCVYDAEHSQENPIKTIDKVVPIGASVNATNTYEGLNDATGEGWVSASVIGGSDLEMELDATAVSSEVDDMIKASAAGPDYMIPLVHKNNTSDDKKIKLGNLFQFVLDFISYLATTITSFASGDYFVVGRSTGAAKMAKDTLLELTAQNALAGNVAPAFDETGATTYLAGTPVSRGGKTYVFKVDHSGAWNASKVEQIPSSETVLKVCRSKIIQTNYIPSSLDDLKENFVYIVQRTTGLTTTGFPTDAPAEGIFKLSVVKSYSSASEYQVEQELKMVLDTSKIWRRAYNTIGSSWSAWTQSNFALSVENKQIFASWNKNLSNLNDAPINSIIRLTITSATTTTNIPSDFLVDSANNGELRTYKCYYSDSNYRIYQELTRDEDNAVWRRKFQVSWSAWEKIELGYISQAPVAIFHNLATNPSDLNNLTEIKCYVVQLTSSSSVSNFPTDYPIGGLGVLYVYKAGISATYPNTNYIIVQRLEHLSSNKVWFRNYSTVTSAWSNWKEDDEVFVVEKQIFASWDKNLANLNDAPINSILKLTITSATATLNIPQDFLIDSANDGELRTCKCYYSDSEYRIYQNLTRFSDGSCWWRTWQSNTSVWGPWHRQDIPQNILTIGQGKQYSTLRAGFSAAFDIPNCKVVVYPGIYDLTIECADILATTLVSNFSPCKLGNGMHVVFMEGAKVTCNIEKGTMPDAQFNSIKEHFEPMAFYFNGDNGDFTLENAVIESKNCRYCVHDDQGGTTIPYIHKYVNCRMYRTNSNITPGNNFIQCIGGGLGKHGTIVIDGGWYKTEPVVGSNKIMNGDLDYQQSPISYHNGNVEDAQSSIEIHNVYLADRGYIQLADYGSSTLKTKLYVSGCRFGLPILHRGTAADSIVNMEIAAQWNNEQSIAGEWSVDESDRSVATFVPGN